MSKNKEQSLHIISKKFGDMEQHKSFKELLIALEESIKEISGAEYGFILRFDKKSEEINILNNNISFKIDKEESILQTFLLSQKPLFENYVVSHKKYNHEIDNPVEIEIQSILIVPIFNRGKTDMIGCIQAVNSIKNSTEFGRYDLRILALLENHARQIFEHDNKIKETNNESNISPPPMKTVRRKTKNELESELKLYEEKIKTLKRELKAQEDLTSELQELVSQRTEELRNSQKKIARYEVVVFEESVKKEERETDNEIKTILNFLTNEVNYFLNGKDKIYLFLEILKNSLHNQEQLLIIDKELEKSTFLNRVAQKLYTAEKLPLVEVSFNIFQTVSEVVNFYSHEFSNRDITFNIFIDPQSPNWIISDEEKIKSLIVHLLNNIYGLVNNGGAIELLVSFSAQNNSLNIEIKGLLPNKLKEIKKLFQNKKISRALSTSSSGLGLSICSNLITILGAKLKLTTIGGDERSFKVNIPIKLNKKSREKVFPYINPKKVGILMDESNLYAYLNVKRYLLNLGIKKENILLFKNHKKINNTTFFHLICFENMLSQDFDMSRFNSISILKYNSEMSSNDYGRGIEVHELYINSYYGISLQKVLFPNIFIEEIIPKTLLVKDSFFNRIVHKFL